jgi:ketosteroid isomerase-like protein
MRNLRVPVVFGVLVVAALVATWARAQSAGSAPEVVKVADAYVKASLAGDVKAIVALYTDDAIEMAPFQPLIKGKAAIEQHYTKEMSGPAKLKSFALTHIESKVSGDIGYDVGTYAQSLSDGKQTMDDTGKYTVIVKRVGSAWKVAYAIYNSDKRPEPMGGSGQ